MIEGQEYAYSNLVYDMAVIIACSVAMMVVGLYKEQIANTRMRQLATHGSLVAATFIIVLLVIIPWLLGIVGYDTVSLHSLLVMGSLGAGILVWSLLHRWMTYLKQSVDGETDRAREARQKDINQIESMLDKKKAEIGNEVHGRLDAHLTDVNQKLEDTSKKVTSTVDGKMGQMTTRIDAALKDVDSKAKDMKDAADASTANINKLKGEVDQKVNEIKGEVNKNMEDLKTRLGALEDAVNKIQGIPSEVETIKDQIKDINVSIAAIADSLLPDENPGGKGPQHSRTLDGQTPATADQLTGNICKTLEKHGFRCVPGQNRVKPDIIIYDRDDGLVAPVLVRPREITDDGENMTRRISRKMCLVGLRYAEEHRVPLVLVVANTATGRLWISVVQHENLKDWKGVTTPEILSKSDEVSGKALEREYRDAIMWLGGVV